VNTDRRENLETYVVKLCLRHNFKDKFLTTSENSGFETKFNPKTISIESIYVRYPINSLWLWNLWLRIDRVEKKSSPYKQMLLNHVSRMEGIRYQSISLTGRPWGFLTDTVARPKQVIYWPDLVTRSVCLDVEITHRSNLTMWGHVVRKRQFNLC